MSRVSDLPGRTRDLLLLAVLDGTAISTLQAAASGQREIEDLAPAEHGRLVHVDEITGRLVFRHPLTRSAVMELATSDQRRFAHRALAGQLTDQPERRAWHLAQAAIGPEEQVANLLEQSAHRILRRGDSVGAVAALLRAAELSPRAADRSWRMAAAAYLGADVTGDLRSVSRLLADARRADPELRDLQAAVAAAYALLNGEGDIDTAHHLVAGAIETWAAADHTDDALLMEALQTLLFVCLWALRPELRESFHAALSRSAPRIPATLYLEVQTIADPVRTPPPPRGDVRLPCCLCAVGSHGPRRGRRSHRAPRRGSRARGRHARGQGRRDLSAARARDRRVCGHGRLAAYRPETESMPEHSGLISRELRPLDNTVAASLLSARFPELAPRVRRRLLAEAQGNPLALLELPAMLTGPQRTALASLPSVLRLGERLRTCSHPG